MSVEARSATRATIPEVEHHVAYVNGTSLHYVSAGSGGSPILLVHGFPESWWTFRRLIPLLAKGHQVFAVDLRGFGDSAVAGEDFGGAMAADDLHQLIRYLAVGPMHVLAQDISGGSVYRLASAHPELVRSLIGVEMGLAGFGLEGFCRCRPRGIVAHRCVGRTGDRRSAVRWAGTESPRRLGVSDDDACRGGGRRSRSRRVRAGVRARRWLARSGRPVSIHALRG
ncbi:alpha/beta fold hydrolase [Gordonia sp. C13]|uniref:alpha/beta fold hydrolase n=1 Tax=Gordonia sp. C13 TaxID=2935078 RepID=UPI0035A979C3